MSNYFYSIFLVLTLISCKKDEFVCDTEGDSPSISCTSTNVSSSINGQKVNFHSDGVTKESEGNYNAGVQQGFWKFYYTNGNLFKEGNFTNGKVKGFWKLYFENGKVNEEGNYDDCVRNGFWKFYYNNSNNSVKREGHYTNGSKSGNWKYYNEDGSVSKEGTC